MVDFYEALAELDPNARNVVMTVVEGRTLATSACSPAGMLQLSAANSFPRAWRRPGPS